MATTNEFNIARYQFAMSRAHFQTIELYDGLNYIHPSAVIGEGTIVHPTAFIGPHVVLGKGCIVKAGAVIGEAGFSFGFSRNNTPVHIAHTGRVIIGNYVSIGSGATVCRGTIDATTIADHAKIDDHVHVAHNCAIGPKTCIAAGTVLCGSVKLGKKVWIGVNASVFNGLRIPSYCLIGNAANVLSDKDLKKGDVIIGNPAKVLKNRMGDFEDGL